VRASWRMTPDKRHAFVSYFAAGRCRASSIPHRWPHVLRRYIMEQETAALAAARRSPQRTLQLTRHLMALANETKSVLEPRRLEENAMHRVIVRRAWLLVACCSCLLAGVGVAAEPRKTENVLLIMTDGLRQQEVFSGADQSLFPSPPKANAQIAAARKQFCRDNPEESRAAVMPFLWNVVAKSGQIYGNRAKQSKAEVANGLKFSYPGFHETLCGHPDPRINSNTPGPNPNVTVLEWLNNKPGYTSRGLDLRFYLADARRDCGQC